MLITFFNVLTIEKVVEKIPDLSSNKIVSDIFFLESKINILVQTLQAILQCTCQLHQNKKSRFDYFQKNEDDIYFTHHTFVFTQLNKISILELDSTLSQSRIEF